LWVAPLARAAAVGSCSADRIWISEHRAAETGRERRKRVRYGIVGWIFTAIACLLYNFAAGMIGGVEIQLEAVQPPPPPPVWSGYQAPAAPPPPAPPTEPPTAVPPAS